MSLTSSPFKDKMHSFFVPTDKEMVQIRALLVDPLAESAKLDAEIGDMEATLSALKSRRDVLNDEIAAYRSLLAPIRRISQHALEEIFLACLPAANNASVDPSQAPLLLGRVCRYWRELAYNTPTLWNTLHVSGLDDERIHEHMDQFFGRARGEATSIPPAPEDVRAAFSGILEKWLSRSASSPLSISFRELCEFIPLEEDTVSTPYDTTSTSYLLIPHVQDFSERIKSLDIAADLFPWKQVLTLDPRTLPELRHARFRECGSRMPWRSALDECALFRHPQLQTIALTGYFRPLDLPCRWERLRNLDMCCLRLSDGNESFPGLSFNGICTILSRCTQLVRATLQLTNDDPLTWNSSPSLIMPNVEELTLGLMLMTPGGISGSVNEGLARLVQLLVLPKLRHLRIGNHFPQTDPHPARPGISISLGSSLTDPESRHEILREYPQLSALHFDLGHPVHFENVGPQPPPPDYNLFTRLDQENLCPELRFLTIRASSLTIADTGLVSFLASRPDVTATLNMGSPGKLDVEEELLKLREDRGCMVNLVYPEAPVPRKWRYCSRRDAF
ncbi:F-box domain-containing protein [Mycena kentingensis (nom. inval.)]|nr:F-box domain-containing protein [Mycena kentingensis (nom. inval.)]